MGDAAGIGPKIIAKTLHLEEIYRICRPLVIGEGTTMHKTIKLLESPLKLHTIEKVAEVKGEFSTVDLLDLHNLNQAEAVLDQICTLCGRAAME